MSPAKKTTFKPSWTYPTWNHTTNDRLTWKFPELPYLSIRSDTEIKPSPYPAVDYRIYIHPTQIEVLDYTVYGEPSFTKKTFPSTNSLLNPQVLDSSLCYTREFGFSTKHNTSTMMPTSRMSYQFLQHSFAMEFHSLPKAKTSQFHPTVERLLATIAACGGHSHFSSFQSLQHSGHPTSS